MDKKEFLQTVLGVEGYYCVMGFKGKDIKQKYYQNIDDLISTAENLCDNEYDVYFALSTFTEAKRKQKFALQVRSLFADIDYGEHHGKPSAYDTLADVINDLKRFCKETGMPMPFIVNSGGGVHTYWPLEEPLTKEAWFSLADRLKEKCIEHDLKIDAVVTSDSARILRMPDTMNWKTGTGRPVALGYAKAIPRSVEFYRGILGEALNFHRPFFKNHEMDEATQALVNNRTSSFKKIMQVTAKGEGCEQLRYIYEKQAEVSEPLWRAGLSITKFCEEGEKASLAISNRHPDFSHEEMQKKLDLISGPFYCSTFRELVSDSGRAKICDNCHFWKKDSTPIALGRKYKEATAKDNVVTEKTEGVSGPSNVTYIIPKYPPPYFRGANGGVFKRIKKEDDEIEVPIYHNDLYVTQRLSEPRIGDSIVIRVHLPKDGVREFTMSMATLSTSDEFRKQMYAKGVVVSKLDPIKEYLLAWVNNMQYKEEASKAHRQFGWVGDKFDSFVLGDKQIRWDPVTKESSIVYNPPSETTEHLFPAFEPKGSLEEWKMVMNFYSRPGMEAHQFIIGSSFGSILTELTAINAALLHVYSPDSGLGKTTALYAGASIWGDPTQLVCKEADTDNSKMLRAEVQKNLPLLIDEFTNVHGERASNFAYQYTSGKQKNRMTASTNQERYRGESWKQTAVSTGNASLIEILESLKAIPKAELMRILELNISKVAGLKKIETDALSMRLLNNYGHAGILFVQAIQRNLDHTKRLYKDTQMKMDAALGLTYQERFYSVLITNSVVALMIAKRIGLLDFDLKGMTAWLKDVMSKVMLRAESMSLDPEHLISTFWAENYNNTLRIKSTADRRSGSGEDDDEDVEAFIVPDGNPKQALVLRYEYDIKALFVPITGFKKWCVQKRLSYDSVYEGLKNGRTSAKIVKKRMAKGTKSNMGTIMALEIDCSGWMDDETEKLLQEAKGSSDSQKAPKK